MHRYCSNIILCIYIIDCNHLAIGYRLLLNKILMKLKLNTNMNVACQVEKVDSNYLNKLIKSTCRFLTFLPATKNLEMRVISNVSMTIQHITAFLHVNLPKEMWENDIPSNNLLNAWRFAELVQIINVDKASKQIVHCKF